MKDILKYAANPLKPYKGYGSIAKGLEVIEFRKARLRYYISTGLNQESAYIQACKDVTDKYGIV